ncbi:uncharacterized protein F4822DRAFT_259030 [Hypoxylon trugodes]|uniref:uncharacterized protein n=1 Tax=Hypoxylon trugodes TaxID=326681 RepID=UPI0021971EFC|nr:uncharacterized protein F4822DRAFT_259030 [Hypoxylon trugodes]KAI1388814.1 hypothetical protein F4822DRAFT_259030 [Hypoxylon trugodes]
MSRYPKTIRSTFFSFFFFSLPSLAPPPPPSQFGHVTIPRRTITSKKSRLRTNLLVFVFAREEAILNLDLTELNTRDFHFGSFLFKPPGGPVGQIHQLETAALSTLQILTVDLAELTGPEAPTRSKLKRDAVLPT